MRATHWVGSEGVWQTAERWSGGLPDESSEAWIGGAGNVRVVEGEQPTVTGMLRLGTARGDDVRLTIDGGKLLCRRDFIQASEAEGSRTEITVEAGALHGVSAMYLGGAGNRRTGGCRAALRIRGGSFLCRVLTLGWGQRSEALLSIEGSRPEAVHLLDYLTLGNPTAGGEPSTGTLAFTLDENGVTPVTVQSRTSGLHLARNVAGNRCRLRIALSAVPPRDAVTLVAQQVPTKGTFDDLPEGAEIVAPFAGRTYAWTLSYRGGSNACDVVLKHVRGHADAAPSTRCRAVPKTPVPLWEGVPRAEETATRQDSPAFAEAEGYGRGATGGRGGRTIVVDRLTDDGPGSLRAAVNASGPRIVVFRTGGAISLRSPLTVREPYLTVDGEAAPDGGITLLGDGLVVQTHDVVLRHFRVRPGDDSQDADALSFHDARRCIADHLSLCWGTDETCSVTGLSDEITVQWCLIAESLNRERHAFAAVAGGERVTWHHNLFAHHVSRVPRFAGIALADFRNNVLYDWGHTAGYGQFERLNYIGNYLKPGPSTTQSPPLIHTGDATVGAASLHLADNFIEGAAEATRNDRRIVGYRDRELAPTPFPAPTVRTTGAAKAYEDVLRHVGAQPLRRDAVDARIVRQVRERTGRIIDHARDVRP